MITDLGLRLATAEPVPSGGVNLGGLGADSVALGLDLSGITQDLRSFNDLGGGGQRLMLAFNVDTTFTSATFGATIEFQLVSLPIVATQLAAITEGRELFVDDASTAIATDQININNHSLPVGTPIHLTDITTTGGISANLIYYVYPDSLHNFKIMDSLADAVAGTNPIDLITGNGSVDVNFIPTIHASSGALPLYLGTTPANASPLIAGSRFHVPLRPLASISPKHQLPVSQTLSQPWGAGPKLGQLAANAQRFFYLRYVPSAAISAGAVTCDIVSEAGDPLDYTPSGFKVI